MLGRPCVPRALPCRLAWKTPTCPPHPASKVAVIRVALPAVSIIAALLSPVGALAASAARIDAVRVSAASGGPALSEDVWKTATPVSDFVQREPREGGAPSE